MTANTKAYSVFDSRYAVFAESIGISVPAFALFAAAFFRDMIFQLF